MGNCGGGGRAVCRDGVPVQGPGWLPGMGAPLVASCWSHASHLHSALCCLRRSKQLRHTACTRASFATLLCLLPRLPTSESPASSWVRLNSASVLVTLVLREAVGKAYRPASSAALSPAEVAKKVGCSNIGSVFVTLHPLTHLSGGGSGAKRTRAMSTSGSQAVWGQGGRWGQEQGARCIRKRQCLFVRCWLAGGRWMCECGAGGGGAGTAQQHDKHSGLTWHVVGRGQHEGLETQHHSVALRQAGTIACTRGSTAWHGRPQRRVR